MPRVQVELPGLLRNPGATGSVQQDPNMYSGKAAALSRLGNVVGDAAQNGISFVERKQALVDQGVLSNEETERMNAASRIQTAIASTPGDPSAWPKIVDEGWKQYASERDIRQEQQQWGPRVKTADALKFNEYKAHVNGSISVQTAKAQVAVANGQIEANAQAKLRADDYEGFVAQMDKLNIYPDQKEEAVRRGLEQGLHQKALSQVNNTAALTPADRVQALGELRDQLNEKNQDGTYTNYEYGRGGLSLSGRQDANYHIDAQAKAAQYRMDVSSRGLVRDLTLGKKTVADVALAIHNGEIDVATAETFAPAIKLALNEADTRATAKANKQTAKDAAGQKVQLGKAVAQDTHADTLRSQIGTPEKQGKLDEARISQDLANKKITPERADELRAQLKTAAESEQSVPDGAYHEIDTRLNKAMADKLFDVGSKGGQPSDKEYLQIRDAINSALLTQPSRLKLVGKLLDMKLADIQDLQEEGSGKFMDRSISEPERAMRSDVLGSLKSRLPYMQVNDSGALMFNQDSRIRAFFDGADKPPSQAEIDAFGTKLKEETKPFVLKSVSDALTKPATPKRVKQNGVTYEYDGTKYVPVK